MKAEKRRFSLLSFFCLLPVFLWPLLFYLASFALLTFPLLGQFNKVYFTDNSDGYLMIWSVWWVRHAVVDLHQNPFTTRLLHFPHGTSLLLHSLSPLNGVVSIPLAAVLTQIQTFNVLVIFAFVGSGISAFWLCRKVTRSYWPSMAGGFSFAFCSYRWAHYYGHLANISTQWIPLFLLGLLCLTRRPRIGTAIATAVALWVTLLCDPYQFFYCVIAAILFLLWWVCVCSARPLAFKIYLMPLLTFAAFAAITSGPIVLAMMNEANRSPITGSHDADLFSVDLLAPWVPDWTWLYSGLTRAIWMPMQTASQSEKAVCLGPVVILAAFFSYFPAKGRPRFYVGSATFFALLAITFLLFSFGPTWRFWDIPITRLTPYRALVVLLPPLRFAGSLSRMIIMAQLALSVLLAAGLSRLAQVKSDIRRTVLTLLFAAALVVESQPRVLPTCPPDVPHWVEVLRDAPSNGAVIDLVAGNQPIDLYYQTIHHRPIAMGDISRVSADTTGATEAVIVDVAQGQDSVLAEMGFRFIVDHADARPLALPLLFQDRRTRLYLLP